MVFPAAKALVVSTTRLGLLGLFQAADGSVGEVGLGDGGIGRVPVVPVARTLPGARWVDLGMVTQPSFLVPWETTRLPDGEYELRALCAETLERLDDLLEEHSGGSGGPGGGGAGSSGDSDRCFIATAAFGSPLAPQVAILRLFRDQYLLPYALGRTVVRAYYTASPPLAAAMREHPELRAAIRAGLTPVVWGVGLVVHGSPGQHLGLLLVIIGGMGFMGWRIQRWWQS